MKKNLLFFMGLLAPAALLAQTRTTVTDGNATNPFTWDCTCVPLPGNDIVINHHVTLDNDFAYGSGSVTINSSGSLTGDVPNRNFGLSGGSFTNHGTFTVGNGYYAGGTFNNDGVMTFLNIFAISGSAHVTTSNQLNVNDTMLVNTAAMVSNSASLHARYTASDGTIANNGDFTGDDLYNSGTVTNSLGVGFTLMNVYNSGTINNGSKMSVSNDFWTSENVTNLNQIVIGHDLNNGDTASGTATLTNNGTISIAHDLNNSETLNGSGSYCIANGSNNAGAVSGTLYICDQTGNDFDNNFGTIAPTVTFCTSGDCSLDVHNLAFETIKSVYPNPVSHLLNIELNKSGNYQVNLVNNVGQQVGQYSINGDRKSVDVSGLAPGLYIYRISGNGQNTSGTFVKE